MPFELTTPALVRWACSTFAEQELTVLDGERITYSEAEQRSADLACSLLAEGVGKGTRVGVLVPNGPEAYVVLMAVMRIGAVAVPINTFYVADELVWTLRNADVEVLLTVPQLLGNDYLERLEAGVPALAATGKPDLFLDALPFLRTVHVLGRTDRSWVAPLPGPVDSELLDAAQARVTAADDQVVIYTSGSTARPKGVIHTHGSTIRQGWFIGQQHDWGPGDRIYMPLPFFWIGGLIYGFLSSLSKGVTTLCELRFDPGATLRLLEQERATSTMGWPHVGPAMAGHPDFATTDLSRLKGPYHQDLLTPERRVPDPGLLVNPLGMTETATSHTFWPPDIPLPEEKRGSLGPSAPDWEHKVVDENGSEVAAGAVGEVCVRGVSLMRGIIGQEHHETFDRDGWYHTGDSASMDADGHIFFVGRTGDLIKTAGASVSPVEVEAVLAALPEVQEASIVGIPDRDLGQVVCGVIAFQPGHSLSEQELKSLCRERLSAYKVPKRWVFMPKSEIPYTTSDKVDKARLIDQLSN